MTASPPASGTTRSPVGAAPAAEAAPAGRGARRVPRLARRLRAAGAASVVDRASERVRAAQTAPASGRRFRVRGAARRACRAARAAGTLAALWCVALTACGLAGADAEGPRARAAVLYVSNARDGTIARLDAADGRALGAPLPAGAAPWRMAVGPAGEALVQPVASGPEAGLTYVGRAAAGWQARPLALGPGARHPLLAGGGRFAVVAYQAGDVPAAAPGARCRVALVDLARGRVAATRDVCAGPDSVVGVAAGGADALAYLAVWRRPTGPESCGGAAGSRVVALRLDTGAPVAVAPLDGVPGPLALAPGSGGHGERLYAVEALPTPDGACDSADYGDLFEDAPGWRVWGLDATTLAPDADHAVPAVVRALAVTPDGEDAFVLAGPAVVLRLPRGSGPAAPFAVLPDAAMGLAATDARLYSLGVFQDRAWGLDRRRGALVQTIPTGRGPLGIVACGSACR